jgi:GGDEF domain-containing protein
MLIGDGGEQLGDDVLIMVLRFLQRHCRCGDSLS